MYLKRLQLENFRSHSSLSLDFSGQTTTVFLGRNGLGKTNILEAIYTLALTKSFRTSQLKELISWDQNYFRIKGSVQGGREEGLEFFYQGLPDVQRSIKKSGIACSVKKYLGTMPVSFFSPEELNLIYLEPSRRRRYLNLVLSQVFPDYLEALIKYENLLRQRNKLLFLISERRASQDDLRVWDEQIIPFGTKLIERRQQFVAEIMDDFRSFYQQISGKKEQLEIELKAAEDLREALHLSIRDDLRRRVTTVGPHRDDLIFYLEGHLASHFASRGECRSLILALKLSERNFFQKHCQKKPIILLDDVFSELDIERQEHLLNLVSDSQVFITTSLEESELPKVEMEKVMIDGLGI